MQTPSSNAKRPPRWWRGAFLYQVYPRSFFDSNGDGTGDLPGITAKMDYIASLGVEGVWICPFFPSPMKDFGYDVSDYLGVDPMFGTLADFDALLHQAHRRGLKIIIDLVLSHTSDQHPWFMDSRSSPENARAGWYVWARPAAGGGPPNNWVSVFGGPAWTFDERRGQYYLHNFLKEQPDLNFHNPHVQAAVLDTARFWLARGVDGFRLDVVNFYFYDRLLRDNPPAPPAAGFATQFEGEDPYSAQAHLYDKSRPENLAFLERLRALLDEYGAVSIGEIGDDDPVARAAEYTEGNQRLHTCYSTAMMGGAHKPLTAAMIRRPVEEFMARHQGWPTWAFSNHDVVRAASRWLAQGGGFGHDPRFGKMLIALLGCLYGTVCLYQGEELGLPEARLEFEDLQDPWGRRLWPRWQGRDGCRTPLPWAEHEPNMGFSNARPWLPLAAAHQGLSAAAQEKDPESVLNFTRQFLARRKTLSALMNGTIAFEDSPFEDVLIFRRESETQSILCLFNLSGQKRAFVVQQELFDLPPYGFEIIPRAA